MKYQFLTKTISALLCSSLLSPSAALAHSGGTDSSGCHRQSSTGSRHCHNSGSDSDVSSSTLYIIGGSVLAIAIGYFLVKEVSSKDNKQASYKQKKAVPRRIDLRLSSSISNYNPVNGELITLNLLLTNEQKTRATDVEISSMLPSELKFMSAFTKQGKYNSSTGIWNAGDIEGQDTVKLIITAKVKSNKSAIFKSEITNAHEIDLDSTPNNDNSQEDDQTSIIINDFRVNTSKTENHISSSTNYVSDFKISESSAKNSSVVEEIALNKTLGDEYYEAALSVKSLGFLKNNYHVELEYKF